MSLTNYTDMDDFEPVEVPPGAHPAQRLCWAFKRLPDFGPHGGVSAPQLGLRLPLEQRPKQ